MKDFRSRGVNAFDRIAFAGRKDSCRGKGIKDRPFVEKLQMKQRK